MELERTWSQKYGMSIPGLLLFCCYVFGMLFPDMWWGSHYISFLPAFAKYSVLLFSSLLIALAFTGKIKTPGFSASQTEKKYDNLFIVGVGIIMGLLFYQFPIVHDNYGNAVGFQKILNERVASLPPDFYDRLFSFEFKQGNGRDGVKHLITFIAWGGGITIEEAFK